MTMCSLKCSTAFYGDNCMGDMRVRCRVQLADHQKIVREFAGAAETLLTIAVERSIDIVTITVS